MGVTILEITNSGSACRKFVVFEHEEDLVTFRERLKKAAQEAMDKRVRKYGQVTDCWDDIFADISDQVSGCAIDRYQTLDLGELVRVLRRENYGMLPKQQAPEPK